MKPRVIFSKQGFFNRLLSRIFHIPHDGRDAALRRPLEFGHLAGGICRKSSGDVKKIRLRRSLPLWRRLVGPNLWQIWLSFAPVACVKG